MEKAEWDVMKRCMTLAVALVAALTWTSCSSSGAGRAGAGPAGPLEAPPERLSGSFVLEMPQADYAQLFDAALAALEPLGHSVVDRDGRRIESRDFGRIVARIPKYGYVEVRFEPGVAAGSWRAIVTAYQYEARFADGLPVGEGPPERYVFVGLDEDLQRELGDLIRARYLGIE